MSATELKDFLAAMDIARQANMAALEAGDCVVDDDDLCETASAARFRRSATIH